MFTWNLHVMWNTTVSLSKNTCFVVWRWVFPMFSNTKFAHYTCWNHPDTRACAVKTMGHISAGVGLLVISLFCANTVIRSWANSTYQIVLFVNTVYLLFFGVYWCEFKGSDILLLLSNLGNFYHGKYNTLIIRLRP